MDRIEHTGNAPETTLQAPLAQGDLSFTVIDGTGYPTGSVGNFYIILDANTADEEVVLCSARASNTFTVAVGGRGASGTSDTAHSAGHSVVHGWVAQEADDANAGLVEVYVEVFDDWDPYTVAWTCTGTAPAIGNGSLQGRYHRLSDTVHFQVVLLVGSTTTFGTGTSFFALPAATGTLRAEFRGVAHDDSAGQPWQVTGWADGLASTFRVVGNGSYVGPTYPFTWATGDTLQITGSYEAG